MHVVRLGSLIATSLLALSARAERPRFELSGGVSFGSGSSTSPVRYAPTRDARIAGDPGAVYGASASPYRAFLGEDLGVGLVWNRSIALGLRGELRQYASTAPSGIQNLRRNALSIGPSLRWSSEITTTVAPFVGATLWWTRDVQRYTRPSAIPDLEEQWTLEASGVAASIDLGLALRVSREFTVAPRLSVTQAIPLAGCASVTSSDPRVVGNELCDSSSDHVTSLASWTTVSIGLGAWFWP